MANGLGLGLYTNPAIIGATWLAADGGPLNDSTVTE